MTPENSLLWFRQETSSVPLFVQSELRPLEMS